MTVYRGYGNTGERRRNGHLQALMARHQVWICLLAIVLGMVTGQSMPALAGLWEWLLWPMLGLLLYTTFTEIPLASRGRRTVFRDWRFAAALLTGNFLVMPLAVFLLQWLIPDDRAVWLGVLLVLLMPCTDWFISFTWLGGGDAQRAMAAAPLLLILQFLLLPVYLWLFMGELAVALALGEYLWQLVTAFVLLILLPLLAAWLTQRNAGSAAAGDRWHRWLNLLPWLPVPLLAAVVFLVAASQAVRVQELGTLLWQLLVLYLLYLLAAAWAGRLLSRFFRLPVASARTLVFSLGTRNSFVALPLALALPEAWHAAVVVIVFQSLVELFGMVAYLYGVPRWLMPADRVRLTLGPPP